MTNSNKNMLITLGVRDVEKSMDFYVGLGFKVKLDGYTADFRSGWNKTFLVQT